MKKGYAKTHYVTLEITAFEEVIKLASLGFAIEETKATDGTPIILAKKNGYSRMFVLGERKER